MNELIDYCNEMMIICFCLNDGVVTMGRKQTMSDKYDGPVKGFSLLADDTMKKY